MKSVLWVVETAGDDGEWSFYCMKQSREPFRGIAKFIRLMGEQTRIVKYVRAV